MHEDTPNTGYSDIDNAIAIQEAAAKMLDASAQQLRKVRAENQQLKIDLSLERSEKERALEEVARLRKQIAVMMAVQPQTTNYIHVGHDYINNQYNSQNNE